MPGGNRVANSSIYLLVGVALDEEVLDKLLELGLDKRLSEAIGHIFLRAHVVELKSTFVDTFTDEKVTHVDVLATTVEHVVLGEVDRALIISVYLVANLGAVEDL